MGKKKLYFRADASKEIGYGHFIRSLALADILKDEFECTFFTVEPTENQRKQIEDVCSLVELPSDDRKFSLFLESLQGSEIVVLDNYFFTPDYQKQIKSKGCKLVCLGTNDRHYYCDILLNFAECDTTIFNVEPYTKVLAGPEWVILRKPFLEFNKTEAERSGLVICFGGTDQFGLTERCVNTIQSEFSNLTIHLIATDVFGKQRIENLNARGVVCHVNATAEEMVKLFSYCRYILSSASTITHEGLACGLIPLCGYYVENQIRTYKTLEKSNLIIGLGDLLENDMESRLTTALSQVLKSKVEISKSISPNRIKDNYKSVFNSISN